VSSHKSRNTAGGRLDGGVHWGMQPRQDSYVGYGTGSWNLGMAGHRVLKMSLVGDKNFEVRSGFAGWVVPIGNRM
jgi:hypothetical protein